MESNQFYIWHNTWYKIGVNLKSSEILKYSHFLVGIVHLLVIGLYISITMSHMLITHVILRSNSIAF